MKKRSKYLLILLLLAGVAGAYAWNLYNAGPRDLQSQKADLTIGADQLLTQFQEDEAKANATYLDKVVLVEGTIASVITSGTKNITLETEDMLSAIVCEMTDSYDETTVSVGDQVKIKGQCTGFLADVILVKCVIEN